MPPAYVKPYVKRHKNDVTDAEAICEDNSARPDNSIRMPCCNRRQLSFVSLMWIVRRLQDSGFPRPIRFSKSKTSRRSWRLVDVEASERERVNGPRGCDGHNAVTVH
jgi:hypothetical protein